MGGDAGEFEEWELLRGVSEGDAISDEGSGVLEAIEEEGGSRGMIRTDYFSLASDDRICTDPAYPRKESGDFWPDSGSVLPEDRKFITFEKAEGEVDVEIDVKHESSLAEKEKTEVGFEGIEEIEAEGDKGKFWSVSGGKEPVSVESGGSANEVEIAIDSSGNAEDGLEILDGEKDAEDSVGESEILCERQNAAIGAMKMGGEEEKRIVVWWKVPFEFLKYCAFRFRPVWTLPVAAAVMGFLILGRRLYTMKKKSQSLQVKVAANDKEASQFLSRAARINEAFSMVNRVPVLRASVPSAG